MPVSRHTAAAQSRQSTALVPYWQSECGRAVIHVGDCVKVMPQLQVDYFHAVVTDPPYGLEFMGKEWDSLGSGEYGFQDWMRLRAKAALPLLKSGRYLLSFGGTRTFHRLACALEDAGFEMRDVLSWMYGTGFPKGRGCLKPAWEPVLLCRRPGPRVLPLNIDACRIPAPGGLTSGGNKWRRASNGVYAQDAWTLANMVVGSEPHPLGRYPANVVLTHHEDCKHVGTKKVKGSNGIRGSDSGGSMAAQGINKYHRRSRKDLGQEVGYAGTDGMEEVEEWDCYPDCPVRILERQSGSARFFYCAKASRSERGKGNAHPTVKPLDLMRWLVRLVCAPGGIVLDPFMGSGSTGCAAILEGMRFVGIEQSQEYADIAVGRLKLALASVPVGSGRGNDSGTPPPVRRLRGAT